MGSIEIDQHDLLIALIPGEKSSSSSSTLLCVHVDTSSPRGFQLHLRPDGMAPISNHSRADTPAVAPTFSVRAVSLGCGETRRQLDAGQLSDETLLVDRRAPHAEVERSDLLLEISVPNDFRTDAGTYTGTVNFVFQWR